MPDFISKADFDWAVETATKKKSILIRGIVIMLIVLSFFLLTRPELLGNMNKVFAEPTSGNSNISFAGEENNKIKEGDHMGKQMINAQEVAVIMKCSEGFDCKMIRTLNKELRDNRKSVSQNKMCK